MDKWFPRANKAATTDLDGYGPRAKPHGPCADEQCGDDLTRANVLI